MEGAQAISADLDQSIASLLQNAVRYTPSGGRVTVGAEARPGTALTHITNTGDGIPAADLPYVFAGSRSHATGRPWEPESDSPSSSSWSSPAVGG